MLDSIKYWNAHSWVEIHNPVVFRTSILEAPCHADLNQPKVGCCLVVLLVEVDVFSPSLCHSRLSPEKKSERDVCVLPLIIMSEVTWLFQECVENDMIGSYIITRIACFWVVTILVGFPRAVCDETTWIILRNTWHEFVHPLLKFHSKLRQKSRRWKEGYHIQCSSRDIDVGLRSTD